MFLRALDTDTVPFTSNNLPESHGLFTLLRLTLFWL